MKTKIHCYKYQIVITNVVILKLELLKLKSKIFDFVLNQLFTVLNQLFIVLN